MYTNIVNVQPGTLGYFAKTFFINPQKYDKMVPVQNENPEVSYDHRRKNDKNPDTRSHKYVA